MEVALYKIMCKYKHIVEVEIFSCQLVYIYIFLIVYNRFHYTDLILLS